MPDDATTRLQRKAQNAVKAIAESDDPPDVRKAELWRVMVYLKRLRDEIEVTR